MNFVACAEWKIEITGSWKGYGERREAGFWLSYYY